MITRRTFARAAGGIAAGLIAAPNVSRAAFPERVMRLMIGAYVEEGRLRALAVMATTRLAAYPEIPAIGEAGLGADLEVQAWQGVLARSGTPPDVIALIHATIAQAMAEPQTHDWIKALAVEPMATDPAAFATFFHAEVTRWTDVARRAGITVQ